MRAARVDVVIVCDNSLPHLESEPEIGRALRECLRCVRPGGGCVISVRDYSVAPEAGTVEIHPYGERTWDGRRYDIRQVWRWQGPRYDLSLEIAPTDGSAPTVVRTSYLAIPPARVAALMISTGFVDVRRIDGRFFQPILVGTRPPQR